MSEQKSRVSECAGSGDTVIDKASSDVAAGESAEISGEARGVCSEPRDAEVATEPKTETDASNTAGAKRKRVDEEEAEQKRPRRESEAGPKSPPPPSPSTASTASSSRPVSASGLSDADSTRQLNITYKNIRKQKLVEVTAYLKQSGQSADKDDNGLMLWRIVYRKHVMEVKTFYKTPFLINETKNLRGFTNFSPPSKT